MAEMLTINFPQDATSPSSSRSRDWLASIIAEGQVETDNHMQWPQIPKVPARLRVIQSNKNCYDPMVVSIGPYHHGKTELRELEKLKLTFAFKLVKDSGISIDDFYFKVAEVADDARKCYAEDLTNAIDNEKFTQIMFLDSCFILQFIFCLLRRPEDLKMTGYQRRRRRREATDQRFHQAHSSSSSSTTFIQGNDEGACPQIYFSEKKKKWGDNQETADHPPVHLLGLLHANHIHKEGCSVCSHQTSDWYSYRSAKDLRTVGIRFRPNWTNAYSNVEFQSSVRGSKLILPPVTIDDSFKSMLLNLIAYETTSSDLSGQLWVSSYACFLDSLIQDVEDVKVLQSEGVLNIFVREQEVADLFNQMSRNLVPNPYAYSDVKRKIELDRKNITKKWVAEWLQTYFSSPWSFIALVAATLTIILTAMQTFMQFTDDNCSCKCCSPAKGT
ncbi:unnamed protein product [Dovyalis caffra]|uniref:Uncharacterized protein n=1 Tax=Dovyalis caffra TaxID=77055 RepID=A0AAV1RJ22_9ROSI|nr:unnamed protein product [Dovyalis caffra]